MVFAYFVNCITLIVMTLCDFKMSVLPLVLTHLILNLCVFGLTVFIL